MRITPRVFTLGLVGLALAWAPSPLLRADPPEKPSAKQPAGSDEQPPADDDAERGEPAGYWIGVQCVPLHDPALRAQLDLDREQGGLVVEDVLPDSPAAKAGIKRFDVLLSAGGSRLHDMHMLQRTINRAAGGELKIELYRGGKQQTVSVKPAERKGPFGPAPAFGQMPPDALQQWLERRWNLPPQAVPPQSMYFFGPGVVMPQAPRGLPDDMSVTIIHKGKEPAKVIVRQGDKTWETTEDKLAELPMPARREVEKLLPQSMPPLGNREAPPFGHNGRELNELLQRQSREINRDINSQLEQLRKRLDRLEQRQTPSGETTR